MRVKEVFATVQGEGEFAGIPAIFVRFSGCNLWSGLEVHRERDAERNCVSCPKFCDTDFVGGDRMSEEDLVKRILAETMGRPFPLVVFTGGEPLLQLTESFLENLWINKPPAMLMMVETNGTVELKEEVEQYLDWVCVSPKVPADRLKITRGDEIKVVYPSYNPLEYGHLEFERFSVQPEAPTQGVPNSQTLKDIFHFCLEHPMWNVSLQQHKYMKIP